MSNSSGNINVICRVRPLIEYESSNINNQEIIYYISDTTIGIGESTSLETFTFDKIFTPSSTQEEVYEYIGKSTIEDILLGYNGTIFVYGQTGSGKTHTMLGSLYDEKMKGVIPRAASQIFKVIENDETETEFTLKCSLLEIYKERLRDLLETDSANLQIKECPSKGIYVKGLTQICITSEKEFVDLVCIGQQVRTVAATRVNSSSSRSHLILILEILQKMTNGCEKKGILNLVDLAGSEKVSNSGVTGNNLEEAKKINLSLSALGKVIHALIYSHDHIPYRDSKLTRLLQESLGGNFKTNLIVSCSPAARSQNETTESLRFAVRAKAIKNKATINLKNPPENYIKIIETLKSELTLAKAEIKLLKNETPKKVDKPILNATQRFQSISPYPIKLQGNLKSNNSSAIKHPSIPKQRKGSADSIAKSTSVVSTTDPESGIFPTSEKVKDPLNSLQSCQVHEIEVQRLQEIISSLKSDKEFLESKIKELEDKLLSSKSKELILEQKVHEYYHSYFQSVNLLHKDSTENSLLKSKNEGLQKQLKKLILNIETMEKKHKTELEEFKNFKESTVLEFKEDPSNKNTSSDIHVISQAEETHTVSFSNFFLSCDPSNVLTPYSNCIKKALEDPGYLSKDISLHILRQELLVAAVANCELTSSISSLSWKITLLKHKYNMKKELCSYQQEHNKKLEEIVQILHKSYTRIVNLTEKLELNALSTPRRLRPKPLQTLIHQNSFTSRALQKQSTVREITNKLQLKIEETSNGLRMKELESNLDLQQLFNTQLKRNNDIYKSQAQRYLELLDSLEKSSYKAERSERERWKKIFVDLRESSENELVRKQEEIIQLNDVVGAWVNSFMALQETSHLKIIETSQYNHIQNLIKETVKAIENISIEPVRSYTQSVIIPSKSHSPFMMSFKGDVPIE